MANGWTLERRQRQSEMIKSWQPWKQSTGARTSDGKAISKMNALKHGLFALASKKNLNQIRVFLNSGDEKDLT